MAAMEEKAQAPPHIVIVPSPGMGHLTPLAEFGKLLSARFGFSITLLLPTSTRPNPTQLAFLASLPPSITHAFLPRVDPALLPAEEVDHEIVLHLTHAHSIPALRAELLARRPVALVYDIFGSAHFDVARELGILPYLFYTTTAKCYYDLFEDPRMPGFSDLPDPLDLPAGLPMLRKVFRGPHWIMIHLAKKVFSCAGVFLNTFLDLEPDAIGDLRSEKLVHPPVYPIGPIIQSGQEGVAGERPECLKWLDRQPAGSVLFVSFGSGGTLTSEQFKELAIGLEKSGQRFLWVVRSPNDHSSDASFFTVTGQDDPLRYLPDDGYLDRVKDRGMLVPSWAPQMEVLSHGSIGGFLTHCGWNSTMESITLGVPLIAWPLFAEQGKNAMMVTQGLKVALRPRANELGLYEADDIASVVKELIEGEEGKNVRHRMKELSTLAKKAISNGGDSTKSLEEVAQIWRQKALAKE